jgi:hypothetical protein
MHAGRLPRRPRALPGRSINTSRVGCQPDAGQSARPPRLQVVHCRQAAVGA